MDSPTFPHSEQHHIGAGELRYVQHGHGCSPLLECNEDDVLLLHGHGSSYVAYKNGVLDGCGSCHMECIHDVLEGGYGSHHVEWDHNVFGGQRGRDVECQDAVLDGFGGRHMAECMDDVSNAHGSNWDVKCKDDVLYDYGNQGIELEVDIVLNGHHLPQQPVVAIATQNGEDKNLVYIEKHEDEEEAAKDKKVMVSMVAVGSTSPSLASARLKKHRPQHHHHRQHSSHMSSSFPSAQTRNGDVINLNRVYANASFSTFPKLPPSNLYRTNNLPCSDTRRASLYRSVSMSSEYCAVSLEKLTPLSSLRGPSFGKPPSQSPKALPSLKHRSSPTSDSRLSLKPATLNIASTTSGTSPRTRTSGPTSRLIALPSVDVKAREEVRLDLRGQKVKSLDCNLVTLTAKLEFVYLRDNKLSHLAGIEILRRVKVLDLSFNEFKGLGMEPLASCKALQQLYLAGNQMTSLSGLPQLPNLEFLSVAQNKLRALMMVTQPKLQVLAASKNKISTFRGFPHLPSLEHLRLEENPLSEMRHVEAVAILLAGPNLKKLNNQDLTLEEQELACMYPPHTALCIRDGWEFCDVEEAFDSSMRFLAAQWADRIPPGYTVEEAFIEQPSEDYPCRCQFTFKKQSDELEELGLSLRYQWFIGGKTPSSFVPIQGAIKEVYWPKHGDIGHCLKVECVLVLGSTEYAPIFAVSFPVLPGTGFPKVISLSVNGDFKEGNIVRGHAEVAWCGGTATRGFVSWLRHDESCSPVMVPGAEELEYLLSLDDVGAKLILMYTPVTREGIKGEPRFATTDVIKSALPSVSNMLVLGDVVEGNTITGVGKYFGGREGLGKFEWLQEDMNSGGFRLVSEGTAELTLTGEDIGLRMMFRYTPVNSEGYQGTPGSVVTEKVSRAPPKVIQLRIVGDICEGSRVGISATISGGGIEGESRVQWFKTRIPDESLGNADLKEIGTSTISKAFHIPLGAVGFYLAAEYTPVLLDGVNGEPALVFSDSPVKMLPPSLSFLSMTGEHREGETLMVSYGYVGGYEGRSQYIWYLHENESDPGTPIAETAGLLRYHVTKAAIKKLVSFKCIPVREDGLVGEEKNVIGQECVQPGPPKLLSLSILGDPMEGSELQVEKLYWGGFEGHSKLQWFQTRPNGTRKAIKGATSHTYTIRTEDIDSLLFVSYEPYRSDGVTGSVVVSQTVGPVLPAPPACEALQLWGEPIEGGSLTFTSIYRGGVKGACKCVWTRQRADGLEQKLSCRDTLKLTLEDVGCCIKLAYTPVRRDGVSGTPKTVVSDAIKEGDPASIRLMIPDCCEDMDVVPQRSYFGGLEGDSDFTWFRLEDKLQESLNFNKAQVLGKSETYTPKLEDVGSYLALLWTPIRKDGKKGKPCLACSSHKVAAAPPSVHNVTVKEVSSGLFVGEGIYHGGSEGESQMRWYRQAEDGTMTLIAGALLKTYAITEYDYTCSLVFGFTPVRQDGIVGRLVLSEPTDTILPELPSVQKLVLTGKAIEGELLVVKEVIPESEKQQHIWEKYIKDVRYKWSRSFWPDLHNSFERLLFQRGCTYTVRTEDIGFSLKCECVVTDTFSRSSLPISIVSSAVAPGMPKVDKLEVEGQGYHTNVYAIRGIYSGGREGKSAIRWFRAMARSPDLIPIAGEVGRMYEANVDDVGYRLVAVYTPVREDGVEGTPVSASIGPIAVEPAIAEEVKQKLELGSLRFEALLDRDPSLTKPHPNQGLGSLEKRVIDVNTRRIRIMKPGAKTSFLGMDMRGAYSPPFRVEANRNDQHRFKLVMEGENEIDLMVQTKHIRDIILLAIKGFSTKIQ